MGLQNGSAIRYSRAIKCYHRDDSKPVYDGADWTGMGNISRGTLVLSYYPSPLICAPYCSVRHIKSDTDLAGARDMGLKRDGILELCLKFCPAHDNLTGRIGKRSENNSSN